VEHYGGTCLDVLTGFKYIGEKIAQWEEEKSSIVSRHHYIFGGEESFGYLLGTHVRDKDAIISAACVCEAALQLKREEKTLVDFLFDIYNTYGIFRENILSLSFEGKEGADRMKRMMQDLRENPPKILAEKPVAVMEDYLTRTKFDLSTGEKEALMLPKSDVLRFWLSDGTKIVVRPSGTEPKIKLYCAVHEKHHHVDRHDMKKALAATDRRLDEILQLLKKMLLA
jgi:phosphomannomutase